MTDIAILWSNDSFSGDIALDAGRLATDDGLRTAILISLFTDARARPDDRLPDDGGDPRGWWGNTHAPVSGRELGSRLWLLGRRKQLPAVLAEAKGYAEEALAWLIKDGIASRVEVDAFIPRDEMLGLAIAITRPNGQPVRYRFEALWASL